MHFTRDILNHHFEMGIVTSQTDSKLSITLLGWNVKDFSSWEKMFRPRKGKIEERTSSFEVQKQVTFDKLLQTNPRLDFFFSFDPATKICF